MSLNIPPPTHFQNGGNIIEWIEELEMYMLAACGKVDDSRQRAILISTIGDSAKKVISNMETASKDTYKNLKAALLKHYEESSNFTIERHIFHTMTQHSGESVDEFHTRLRTQSLKCHFKFKCSQTKEGEPDVFHDISDESIRDQLICGIADGNVRQRLFREQNLNLQRTLEIIRTIEIANSHYKKLVDSKNSPAEVNAMKAKKRKFHKPQIPNQSGGSSNRNSNGSSSNKMVPCKFCAQRHERSSAKCPAFGNNCEYCNGKNHMAVVCWKRIADENQEQEVNATYQNSHTSESCYCTHTELCSSCDNGLSFDMDLIVCEPKENVPNEEEKICIINTILKDWFESIEINGTTVSCKIDTGAQANVIPKSALYTIGYKAQIKPSNISIKAYGGARVPTEGKVTLHCMFGDKQLDADFIVVDLNVQPILGLNTSYQFGFVAPSNTSDVSVSQMK